jgi:hypothetical protein
MAPITVPVCVQCTVCAFCDLKGKIKKSTTYLPYVSLKYNKAKAICNVPITRREFDSFIEEREAEALEFDIFHPPDNIEIFYEYKRKDIKKGKVRLMCWVWLEIEV